MPVNANPARLSERGPERIVGPWRSQRVPHAQADGHVTAARPDLLLALTRADWLETALSDLPVVDPNGPWQSAVHQRHARRHAESALAACLRSVLMGRATITMAETAGTSIRMFGIRALSTHGFTDACRLWIEEVRQQASAGD
jgi:hypothetical protein